jgi:hypothetical protein
MTRPLSPEQLDRLRWLLEQQDRRLANHPETLHHVTVQLDTDNLWAAQLEAMAEIHGVDIQVLMRRYLSMGFQADLDTLHASEGPRIGRNPRKS